MLDTTRPLLAIGRELQHAENKHPLWPSDLLRQIAIIQEEAGELQKEALNLTEWRERGGDTEQARAIEARMNTEAAQLGAMVVRFLAARL